MHPESEHGLRVQLATALRERDEALAQETYWHNRATEARDELAAALRAVEAETLERAAQALDSHRYINASKIVRALASPAAAPAAETARCMCPPGAVAGSCPLRNDVQSICECRCHDAPPSEPAAPTHDLRNQRNRFEKCAQLFAEIRGDWTDPRDACREGRKLCMEALAAIDAALTARAATPSTPGDGSAET